MLSVERINQIRTILSSDRLSVKGNEVMTVALIIQDLQREEQSLIMADRVKPAPLPPVAPPDQPVE